MTLPLLIGAAVREAEILLDGEEFEAACAQVGIDADALAGAVCELLYGHGLDDAPDRLTDARPTSLNWVLIGVVAALLAREDGPEADPGDVVAIERVIRDVIAVVQHGFEEGCARLGLGSDGVVELRRLAARCEAQAEVGGGPGWVSGNVGDEGWISRSTVPLAVGILAGSRL